MSVMNLLKEQGKSASVMNKVFNQMAKAYGKSSEIDAALQEATAVLTKAGIKKAKVEKKFQKGYLSATNMQATGKIELVVNFALTGIKEKKENLRSLLKDWEASYKTPLSEIYLMDEMSSMKGEVVGRKTFMLNGKIILRFNLREMLTMKPEKKVGKK